MFKRFLSLILFLPLLLAFDGWGQTTFSWNFGTTSGSAAPSGTLTGLTVGSVSIGNTTGSVTMLSTTSASSGYTGSSGQFNAGNAARTGALVTGSSGSAYFEFTLTPEAGKIINLSSISFGTRSTSTAPVSYTLRSSSDSYASDIATGTISANSTWSLKSNTSLTFTGSAGTAVTFRIYGYGGSGSAASNTINWRIDDLSIVVSLTTSGALTPPTLTADATNNTVDNEIDITFTDDATWRAAITAVKVGSTALTATTDYVISAGNLKLKPAGLNALLTASGSKSISLEATGYNNATVTQVINPGAPTTNSTATISAALALGATRTVTATAKDQFNNLVSGYTFKYDVLINNSLAFNAESYTIDGTARTGSVGDIDVVTATNASGVATFTIVVPATVDQGDGLEVQVQLANGSSNVGTNFTIYGPNPTVTYTGVDPSTNSFSLASYHNILYRIQLAVTNNPAELDEVHIDVAGTYVESDILSNGFNLWYSTDATLDHLTDQLIATESPSGDYAQTLTFVLGSDKLLSTSGTHYLFVTVDLDPGANRGSNIKVFPTPESADFYFINLVNPAGSFADANTHSFSAPAPELTADATNNTVDNDIEITFSDDATWRAAVTAVKINGTTIDATHYTLTAGVLTLKPSVGSPLLTASGSKAVAVEATDFGTASVNQVINPGIPTANSTASISAALALNTTRTVTLTAKDQYNNLVSGYAFKYDVTVTDNNAITDESYTIDGTGRASSASDLTVTTTTNSSGVATFTVTIPAVVDANDGVNIQAQLADGTTNVGSAFSFGNTPGVTITGTDPGTGKFVRSNTQQVLYRYQIAVTSASVTLNQIVAVLTGTYTADDLGPRSLKLYYSTNTTLDGADPQIGSSVSPVSTGSGETITFSTIGKLLPIGTSYVFLTTDVKYDATLGRTIAGASNQDAQITFAESITLTPGTYGVGNSHEIRSIPGAPTDLIISEYVEGSSNTKYLEIYNGTGSPIDLSDYKLGVAANGASSPTLYQMYTTLPSGSVKVYKNSSASDLVGVDDSSSSAINYNGDDALAIYKISTDSYVDIFGRIGEDPGSAWTGGGLSTVDKTLRRKSNVTEGVTTNPSSGFPTLATEWDQYNIDVVAGLGSHSISLNTGNYSQSVNTGNNNYAFIGTGLQINFVNVTTGATVTVTRYEGSPTGTDGIGESNVANFRWVIEDNGIVLGDPATLRFKASSLTGISDPTTATIKLYKRPTAGTGTFTLIGTLTYDAATDEFLISGITSFSEFVMASEGSPLPVELTSFTARAQGTSVTLNWETKTEIDNNGFEVERNANGTWHKIGFVEGHGTANSPKYYSFSDANPLGNKIQYRLKQIDNDGDFEYSDVVEVELAPVTYTLYQNYPNPFNPSTVIRYALPAAGIVTIDVFNALGEKVATLLNSEVEAGYNQVSFDATNLPSGLYFYRIQSGDFTSIKKMLLMK